MVKELTTWAKFGPPLGHTWEPTESERLATSPRCIPSSPTTGRSSAPIRPTAARPIRPEGRRPGASRLRPRRGPRAGARPRAHAGLGRDAPAEVRRRHLAGRRVRRLRADRRRGDGRERQGARRQARRHATANAWPCRCSCRPRAYLAAVARRGGKDLALRETRADLRSDEWYDIAAGKGVLVLAELRSMMGDGPFTPVHGRVRPGPCRYRGRTRAEFFRAAEQAHGQPMTGLADAWLGPDALARLERRGPRPPCLRPVLVGQLVRATAREGRDRLRHHGRGRSPARGRRAVPTKLASRFANVTVPIKADTDVTESQLRDAHILLVGRPSTNRWTARLAEALPVRFGAASVKVADETFAHPRTAVVAAGPSPMAADRSVVVFAGLSAEGTWDVRPPVPRSRRRHGRGHGHGGRRSACDGSPCRVPPRAGASRRQSSEGD